MHFIKGPDAYIDLVKLLGFLSLKKLLITFTLVLIL